MPNNSVNIAKVGLPPCVNIWLSECNSMAYHSAPSAGPIKMNSGWYMISISNLPTYGSEEITAKEIGGFKER